MQRKHFQARWLIDETAVGTEFTTGCLSDKAVAYCKRRKTLAEPFVKKRNGHLTTSVMKEMAMSQQLTNTVEAALGSFVS